MAKILQFPLQSRERFGFKPVRKARTKAEAPGQLNLFRDADGKIIRFPADRTPFELALLLDEHERDEAAELYRKAIDQGDCIADAYCNLGIVESKRGNVAKAFDCFTRSLKEDPRHFESHYNLGNLYFDGDNLKLARMHYELAAEIDPAYAHLFFNLGLVCAMCEEYTCAIDALQKYKRLTSKKDTSAEELLESLKSVSRN